MSSPVVLLALSVLGLAPAHPFGRASMDQSLFVQLAGDELSLSLELDVAETLTAELIKVLDQDRDGAISPGERRSWLGATAETLAAELEVRVAPTGARVPYHVPVSRRAGDLPSLSFPPGEEALPTLLLSARYQARLKLAPGRLARVEVCNRAYGRLPGLQTTELLTASGAASVADGPIPGDETPSAADLARCVNFEVSGARAGAGSGAGAGVGARVEARDEHTADPSFAWVSAFAGLALIVLGLRALFQRAGPGASAGSAWRRRGIAVLVLVLGAFVALQALQQLGFLRVL